MEHKATIKAYKKARFRRFLISIPIGIYKMISFILFLIALILGFWYWFIGKNLKPKDIPDNLRSEYLIAKQQIKIDKKNAKKQKKLEKHLIKKGLIKKGGDVDV